MIDSTQLSKGGQRLLAHYGQVSTLVFLMNYLRKSMLQGIEDTVADEVPYSAYETDDHSAKVVDGGNRNESSADSESKETGGIGNNEQIKKSQASSSNSTPAGNQTVPSNSPKVQIVESEEKPLSEIMWMWYRWKFRLFLMGVGGVVLLAVVGINLVNSQNKPASSTVSTEQVQSGKSGVYDVKTVDNGLKSPQEKGASTANSTGNQATTSEVNKLGPSGSLQQSQTSQAGSPPPSSQLFQSPNLHLLQGAESLRALKIEGELQGGSVVYVKPEVPRSQMKNDLANYVSPGLRGTLVFPEGLVGIPGAVVEGVLESPLPCQAGIIPAGVRLLGKVSGVYGDRLMVHFIYLADGVGTRIPIHGVVFDSDGQGVRGVVPRDWSQLSQLADRAMILVPGVGSRLWQSGMVQEMTNISPSSRQPLKVSKGKRLGIHFLDIADRIQDPIQDPLLANYSGFALPPNFIDQRQNQGSFHGPKR